MQLLARTAVAVLLVGGAVACTASLDLDRFRTDPAEQNGADGGGTSSSSSSSSGALPSARFRDVYYVARAMTTHRNEYFELRVVDKDNAVQAKAVYNNITFDDFDIYLASAVPASGNPPYRIDTWADHNRSGKYDGIVGGIDQKDHAWRRILQEPYPDDVAFNGNLYTLNFLHDTIFTDMLTDLEGNKFADEESLLNYTGKVSGAGAYVGKRMDVRVVEKASRRLVGFYREGRAQETFEMKISGILESAGTTYEVSAFIDLDEDGLWEADKQEPSWMTEFTTTAEGGTSTLDLATAPQTPIVTGQP